MPIGWVEPAVCLDGERLGGELVSSVYYCYDWDCVMHWHYQIQDDRFNTGFTAFDVRDLAAEVGAGRDAGFTTEEHQSLVLLACSEKPLVEWLGEIGYEGETGP